jgi:hypothetical protein
MELTWRIEIRVQLIIFSTGTDADTKNDYSDFALGYEFLRY